MSTIVQVCFDKPGESQKRTQFSKRAAVSGSEVTIWTGDNDFECVTLAVEDLIPLIAALLELEVLRFVKQPLTPTDKSV